MKRIGRVVGIRPELKTRYLELHANPWPEVTRAIHACNIRNFSIYLKGETLFSYFEYIGQEYENDMRRLDELTEEWLKETDRCQIPVEDASPGELWSSMEEIFYQE